MQTVNQQNPSQTRTWHSLKMHGCFWRHCLHRAWIFLRFTSLRLFLLYLSLGREVGGPIGLGKEAESMMLKTRTELKFRYLFRKTLLWSIWQIHRRPDLALLQALEPKPRQQPALGYSDAIAATPTARCIKTKTSSTWQDYAHRLKNKKSPLRECHSH